MGCLLASDGLCSQAESQRVGGVGHCIFHVWRHVWLVLPPFFLIGFFFFVVVVAKLYKLFVCFGN